jgi:hypothetical protein
MAKRKRLILEDSAMSEPHGTGSAGAAPETKAYLRPGLEGGNTPPIAQVAAEASATAALRELSETIAAVRAEGRMVLRLPLADIEPDHLVRDRLETDEEALSALIGSLRAHGQRMPIEVADLGAGRYGLISGWRRLSALTRLADEDARFGTVLALVRRPAQAAEAYVAMVEENEVRLGLSHYERARIVARAADLGVFGDERAALRQLFAAAPRARRSKIGSFLTVYRALDGILRFPTALPERLGLAVARALDTGAATTAGLTAVLAAADPATAAEEQAALARALMPTAPARAADLAKVPEKGSDTAKKVSVAAETPAPTELRPGVFLAVGGGFLHPVLTLSGPGVDPTFRERLEAWIATGS